MGICCFWHLIFVAILCVWLNPCSNVPAPLCPSFPQFHPITCVVIASANSGATTRKCPALLPRPASRPQTTTGHSNQVSGGTCYLHTFISCVKLQANDNHPCYPYQLAKFIPSLAHHHTLLPIFPTTTRQHLNPISTSYGFSSLS